MKVADPAVLAEIFAVFDETESEELVSALLEMGNVGIPGLAQRLVTIPARRYDILSGFSWNQAGADLTQLVPGLIQCLSDEEGLVRATAVQVLEKIGKPAVAAMPQLLAALDDKNFATPWHAVRALATVASVPMDVLQPIVGKLDDEDEYLRQYVVQALALLDVPPIVKLPYLVTALSDTNLDAVKEATSAIGTLGRDGGAAESRLLELAGHDDSEIRLYAIDALAKISDSPAVLATLRTALGKRVGPGQGRTTRRPSSAAILASPSISILKLHLSGAVPLSAHDSHVGTG